MAAPNKPGATLKNLKTKGKFYRSGIEDDAVYVLSRINRKPSIADKRNPWFPEMRTIKGIDVIVHEGKTRTIRLVEGQTSIFADEQSPGILSEHIKDIVFKDGQIVISPYETLTKQFLDLCNANKSNPKRDSSKQIIFQKFEPQKFVEAQFDKDEELSRAIVILADKCKTEQGVEDLCAYALALGINVDRPFSMIRHDLKVYLQSNPTGFLDGMDSDKMKRKYIVMEALKQGVIIKDPNSGAMSWSNNGGTFCVPPLGVDSVEYMVNWSFDKGAETYEHLRKKIEEFHIENA